jgi:hypothetical protein
MSAPASANRTRQFAVAGFVFALLPYLPVPALAASAIEPAPAQPPVGGPVKAEPARQMLIARVRVNTVNKGDIAILRDARGHTFVPLADYAKWGCRQAVPHW